MNKKGFTLVELMGVIAVMAVLIVVVATNGFGVFNKAKSSINKLEEDNLLEGARVFLVDVDNNLCPSIITDCEEKRNECVVTINSSGNKTGSGCIVEVSFLEEYDYFDDKANRCKGEQTLNLKIENKLDADNNIIETNYIAEKVNSTDVICEN